MAWRSMLAAAAAVLVSACGGAGSRASRNPTLPKTRSVAAQAAAGIRGRLLMDYELGGFQPAAVTVYGSLQQWLSDQQLPPRQRATERAILSRNGFRAAAREDLTNGGSSAVSIVERFRSPPGARRACDYEVSRLETAATRSGAYTAFTVPDVVEGAGIESTGPAGPAVEIVFSRGAYLYLVAEFVGGRRTTANLIAAAQHLYGRVRG